MYVSTDCTACTNGWMLDGSITVWPETLAGNLFWRIGSFESNPPIFHPPNTAMQV